VCGFIPTAGSNPALSAIRFTTHKPLPAGVCCFSYFFSPSDLKTPVTVSETESYAEVKVEQPDKLNAVMMIKDIEIDLNTFCMGILVAELNDL